LKLLSPSVRFVEGDVVQSLKIESNLPESISVLRLDTDWYESTRAELEVLYPRLSPGGVLIIDDYGHWGGAKKAVDEYFRGRPKPLLQYTDYTGRMGVKPL
jgi:predicted O-methyltransferase YrrM